MTNTRKALIAAIAMLVLCAAVDIIITARSSRQGAVTKWFDTHSAVTEGWTSESVTWEDYTNAFNKEISVDGLPGMAFTIEDTEESGPRLIMIKDGAKELLFEPGWQIDNAYFCDINGDKAPELCVTRIVGSGLIDMRICAMDFKAGKVYELSDRGQNDYLLLVKDGRLCVRRQTPMTHETVLEEGPLQLKNGELIIGK